MGVHQRPGERRPSFTRRLRSFPVGSSLQITEGKTMSAKTRLSPSVQSSPDQAESSRENSRTRLLILGGSAALVLASFGVGCSRPDPVPKAVPEDKPIKPIVKIIPRRLPGETLPPDPRDALVKPSVDKG